MWTLATGLPKGDSYSDSAHHDPDCSNCNLFHKLHVVVQQFHDYTIYCVWYVRSIVVVI